MRYWRYIQYHSGLLQVQSLIYFLHFLQFIQYYICQLNISFSRHVEISKENISKLQNKLILYKWCGMRLSWVGSECQNENKYQLQRSFWSLANPKALLALVLSLNAHRYVKHFQEVQIGSDLCVSNLYCRSLR